jgi:hypothetical protein
MCGYYVREAIVSSFEKSVTYSEYPTLVETFDKETKRKREKLRLEKSLNGFLAYAAHMDVTQQQTYTVNPEYKPAPLTVVE